MGVALNGIDRPAGDIDPFEDTSRARRRQSVPEPQPILSGKSALEDIARRIELTSGSDTLATRWREAVATSMAHKEQLYREDAAKCDAEIADQHRKLNEFVRLARMPLPVRGGSREEVDPGIRYRRPEGRQPAEDTALAQWQQTDKWDIVKENSDRWRSLIAKKAAMREISEAARARKDSAMTQADGRAMRAEFAEAVRELAEYEAQPMLLDSVADIIHAFVNGPLVTQNAFINFILTGPAGVGKTRLARSLGRVLCLLGMYAYDDVVECGRSDFVAEYEGQTAVKARTFLTSNLEKIIFLDEAYSLTTWTQKADGRAMPDAYSAEATTELVAFLSQYVGRSCVIAAGYEYEMMSEFLPANDGLPRRFTYIVKLNEYNTEQMIGVYLDALAKAMSIGADQKTAEEVRTYFTRSATLLLADVILGSREMAASRGKMPPAPRHPTLHELFEPQAGAMVNLANVTAILIASSPKGRDRVGLSVGGRATWAIGFRDMRDVLITQLKQRFPEETGEGQTSTGWRAAVDELILIARENGWVVGGEWVPSAAAAQALSGDGMDDESSVSSATTSTNPAARRRGGDRRRGR